MELLKALGVIICIVSTACTLTLDPDELTADLKTGGGDTTVTTGDADVTSDSATTADTTDITTTTAPDVEPDSDATEPTLDLAYPGAGSCQLDYYFPLGAVTGCTATCPVRVPLAAYTWEVTFDIRDRPDIQDADVVWRFDVKQPPDSTVSIPSESRTRAGRRVTLTLELDEACSSQSSNEPADVTIGVEIAIGDGGFKAQPDFHVDMDNRDACSTKGACPDPPEAE